MLQNLAEELGLLAPLEEMMHPYREKYPAVGKIPATGQPREQVLAMMEQLRAGEEARWREGYASGSVYHGDDSHIEFVNRIYSLHSQTNQLHSDLWPSAAKFEAEIVADDGAHAVGRGRRRTRGFRVWRLRLGQLGRVREHLAGDEDLS